jgi:predicted chitinase
MSFRTVNGNTHTEDGWRCCNVDECEVSHIPDLFFTDTAPIRTGPPHIILSAWMYWYDRNVEEIDSPVWGWSEDNDVLGQPGQNNGSNHLGGTAIDVNAPKYPWGTRTMSAAKIAKVEEGLRLFSLDGQESGIYWGRWWDYADEMHYQMAWPEGDPRNDKLMKKLLDGYLGIYKKDDSPVVVPTPPKEDPATVLYDAVPIIDEDRAAELLPLIVKGLELSECTTVNAIAMWLAQIGHESDNFNATEEYAKDGRYAPYIGRTWIQITWKENYARFGAWCAEQGLIDDPDFFVKNPVALAEDKWAAIGPAWYWTVARPSIPELADAGEIVAVTKLINGGTNGLYSPPETCRQDRYNQAIALGDRLLALLPETEPIPQKGDYVPTQEEWNALVTDVKEIRKQLDGDWPQNSNDPAAAKEIDRRKAAGERLSLNDIACWLKNHVSTHKAPTP